jgi:hypothetical protein
MYFAMIIIICIIFKSSQISLDTTYLVMYCKALVYGENSSKLLLISILEMNNDPNKKNTFSAFDNVNASTTANNATEKSNSFDWNAPGSNQNNTNPLNMQDIKPSNEILNHHTSPTKSPSKGPAKPSRPSTDADVWGANIKLATTMILSNYQSLALMHLILQLNLYRIRTINLILYLILNPRVPDRLCPLMHLINPSTHLVFHLIQFGRQKNPRQVQKESQKLIRDEYY